MFHAKRGGEKAARVAAYNGGVNPDPIPEPATLGLLAAGGLLMLRRRSA